MEKQRRSDDQELKEENNEPKVIVGSAFDFLFEGENNDYDAEYADYI